MGDCQEATGRVVLISRRGVLSLWEAEVGTPTVQGECGLARLWETGLGTAPFPSPVPTVLAHELLSDGGEGTDRRQRSEMPKVTYGAPAPPREIAPGSQGRRAEGRGQPEHLSTCRTGGRAGLGLGAGWTFLLFLCTHKIVLV